MMNNFYIPQYRWQYVEWLLKRYPAGKFKAMRLRQLRAIYINIRKKEGN
jgi:hypothetical protein